CTTEVLYYYGTDYAAFDYW
nr:immunoglobulin heavy chain junction region [Macaca mulatta]MOX38719.1 immunoglobulin heavy chain junction region [Macaca mulatta]MOX38877.1 immunoglobulin heavy chain junction region [Macaca mulatta]